LEIKILVVLHSLPIKLAALGGACGHRHGPGRGFDFQGLIFGKNGTGQDEKGAKPHQDAALHGRFSLEPVILRSTTAQSVASLQGVTKVTEGLRRAGRGTKHRLLPQPAKSLEKYK